MLRESFLGKNPSRFQFNPIVKAFIISEGFLWSAYNFLIPIFAIFVVNNIIGGNIQIAASAFSCFLVSRVLFELIICRFLLRKSEKTKLLFVILGTVILSVSYFGFSFATNIPSLFIFFVIAGMGLGIASPPKNATFSIHLDKNKEETEWGLHDAVVFMGMASTTALGGFIATQYGFSFLFILAAIVNLLAIIPYLLYIF